MGRVQRARLGAYESPSRPRDERLGRREGLTLAPHSLWERLCARAFMTHEYMSWRSHRARSCRDEGVRPRSSICAQGGHVRRVEAGRCVRGWRKEGRRERRVRVRRHRSPCSQGPQCTHEAPSCSRPEGQEASAAAAPSRARLRTTRHTAGSAARPRSRRRASSRDAQLAPPRGRAATGRGCCTS